MQEMQEYTLAASCAGILYELRHGGSCMQHGTMCECAPVLCCWKQHCAGQHEASEFTKLTQAIFGSLLAATAWAS